MKIKIKIGDVMLVPLVDGKCILAQYFWNDTSGGSKYSFPNFAFFDHLINCGQKMAIAEIEHILLEADIVFRSYSESSGYEFGRWQIIGHHSVADRLMEPYENLSGDIYSGFHVITKYPRLNKCEYRDASKKDEKNIREENYQFWGIEDDLRAYFGMPAIDFDREIRPYCLKSTTGMPEVVGEWGTLGNDQAWDWLEWLTDSEDPLAPLEEAFNCNTKSYMQVDDGRIIMAAAEALLALLGKARKGAKNHLEDWLRMAHDEKLQESLRTKALIPKALTAVDCALDEKNSELRQLMEELEEDEKADWLKGVNDLKKHYAELR